MSVSASEWVRQAVALDKAKTEIVLLQRQLKQAKESALFWALMYVFFVGIDLILHIFWWD